MCDLVHKQRCTSWPITADTNSMPGVQMFSLGLRQYLSVPPLACRHVTDRAVQQRSWQLFIWSLNFSCLWNWKVASFLGFLSGIGVVTVLDVARRHWAIGSRRFETASSYSWTFTLTRWCHHTTETSDSNSHWHGITSQKNETSTWRCIAVSTRGRRWILSWASGIQSTFFFRLSLLPFMCTWAIWFLRMRFCVNSVFTNSRFAFQSFCLKF